ncbi:DUF3626 domain-containing protein [Micromonospora sp. NPDC050980]|uniref:DUF3626 domain-containing protein n=1 Tax=Micromonospora sp. NPDC050980 TaxID=3155161 RepID=UPI0033BFD943
MSSGPALDRTLRITVNFHPDRLCGAGRPMLAALVEDGIYRSQFVTGTSNGSLTAHPERRPISGALDFLRSPFGAAPRFGSSYFRLSADVLDWATCCYPDSPDGPTRNTAATSSSTWVSRSPSTVCSTPG